MDLLPISHAVVHLMGASRVVECCLDGICDLLALAFDPVERFRSIISPVGVRGPSH
jgi:hypothetical protein